jgi:hypothetical protein
MKRIFLLTLVLLIVFGMPSFTQTISEPASIPEKEYRELKEEYSKLIDRQLQLEQERMAIIDKLHTERKDFQSDIKSMYAWALGILGFIGACIGGVIVFFEINTSKSIYNKVEKAVDEKIGKVVEAKTEILETQMNALDKVATYKKRMKILIISDASSTIDFIEKLKKVGFKGLSDGKFDDYFQVFDGNIQTKPAIKSYNIVFINGIRYEQTMLEALFSGTNHKPAEYEELFSEKLILALKPKPIFFFKNRIPQNTFYLTAGSATMPSQVYGNLINLIEFTSS